MLLVTGLGGCGRAGGPPEREVPPWSGEEAPEPLRLRLEVPARVPGGRDVVLRLVLQNAGDRPVEVGLVGRPTAFDLVVATADGRQLWRRLEGVAVPDLLQPRALAPGEEVVFTHAWDQRSDAGRRVGPGTYRVRGSLPVADAPAGWEAEPQPLTILP